MMMSNLAQRARVRRAVLADTPGVVRAIEIVCAENVYFQTDTFVLDRHWEAVLYRPESAPQHLLAVADFGGEIIGLVRLFAGMCGPKDWHVAELGILVLPAYRRQGIGALMMGCALDWAAGQTLKKIVLSVFATNHVAIRLYKRFGFSLEATRKMQYNVGGSYIDEFLMAKFLS